MDQATAAGTQTYYTDAILELWGPQAPDDRYGVFDRLRAQGDVVLGGKVAGDPIYLALSHAACFDVQRRPDVSKMPLPGTFPVTAPLYEGLESPFEPSMITSDPPDHTRLRMLVSKAFTPRAIQQWRERAHQVATDLIDGFVADGEVELMDEFATPFPITVISEVLGIPEEDRDRFRQWGLVIGESLDGIPTPEFRQLVDDTGRELADYFADLFERRRSTPADDVLTALLQAEESGDRLSTSELVKTCNLLLLAGFETTVNLIGNGMLALLDNPDQLALLRDDPSLAANAVDELLRFDGPIQMNFRYAAQDLELAGTEVPQGALIVSCLAAANRDPSYFDDPDRLDITRGNAHDHLAFASGIHYCLGASLARLEGEVAFNVLLDRLSGIRFNGTVRRRKLTLLRGLGKLPLAFG